MNTLTTVILTSNSETTVLKSINSTLFSDEILIVDDNSTDKTLELIKSINNPKINIVQNKLNNDFSAQRNLGLKSAKGEWVLFLDSDEYLTKKLKAEIQNILNSNPPYEGFYLKRKDLFLGKILKYGETGNIKLLRLAKRNKGLWQGSVHETWQINGKTTTLNYPIIHDRNLTIAQFLDKINTYSTLKAQELYQQNIEEDFLKTLTYPLAKFISNYFLKFGFLDGFPGLTMAWCMSWHSLLVRIKLKLLWLNKGKDIFTIS
jgi:glycosyltransferase involved in cell wall biosynthesis